MSLRLLLVDADARALAARAADLIGLGVRVAASTCCAECLALLAKTERIDLSVVDYDAPNAVQPGCGLGCPVLKSRRIPFMIASDDFDRDRLSRAIEVGACAFVGKSAPTEEFAQTAIVAAACVETITEAAAKLDRAFEKERTSRLRGTAIGIVMAGLRVSEAEASRILNFMARSSRDTVASVSHRIVERSAGLEILGAAVKLAGRLRRDDRSAARGSSE